MEISIVRKSIGGVGAANRIVEKVKGVCDSFKSQDVPRR